MAAPAKLESLAIGRAVDSRKATQFAAFRLGVREDVGCDRLCHRIVGFGGSHRGVERWGNRVEQALDLAAASDGGGGRFCERSTSLALQRLGQTARCATASWASACLSRYALRRKLEVLAEPID